MEIDTFVGSITDSALGAHVIVNAGNPEVALGSGVSGAIREVCGPSFQAEVRERLEEDFGAPLEPGDCLVTGAGIATAFRHVLHVPSVDYRRPDRRTGLPTSAERVIACAHSVIREAARVARETALEGQLVVGLPVLGAGHGGLGLVAGLDALMAGAKAAMREEPAAANAIARLVIVGLDAETARLARLAAAKHGLPVRTAPGSRGK